MIVFSLVLCSIQIFLIFLPPLWLFPLIYDITAYILYSSSNMTSPKLNLPSSLPTTFSYHHSMNKSIVHLVAWAIVLGHPGFFLFLQAPLLISHKFFCLHFPHSFRYIHLFYSTTTFIISCLYNCNSLLVGLIASSLASTSTFFIQTVGEIFLKCQYDHFFSSFNPSLGLSISLCIKNIALRRVFGL